MPAKKNDKNSEDLPSVKTVGYRGTYTCGATNERKDIHFQRKCDWCSGYYEEDAKSYSAKLAKKNCKLVKVVAIALTEVDVTSLVMKGKK